MSLADKLISLALIVSISLNVYQLMKTEEMSSTINKAATVIYKYENIISEQASEIKELEQYKYIKEQLSKATLKKTNH